MVVTLCYFRSVVVALLQKDKTLQKVHSASVLPGSKETIDSRVEQ